MLLVDLDPQANASALTDAQPRVYEDGAFGKAQQLTVSDALHAAQERGSAAVQPGTLYQVTAAAGEHWSARLHVAPASQDVAARNVDSFVGADRRLAVAPDSASPPYDLVVVDCGPTLYGLFVAATFAADAVLLISAPAANALEGLPRTIVFAASLRRSAPPTSDRCCSGCCRPAPLVRLRRASCSSGGCTSYGFEPDVNKGSSGDYNVVISQRCSAMPLTRFGLSTLRHWSATGPQRCGLVPLQSFAAAGL